MNREVSLHYAYGKIRLTWLNFYAPFVLGKSNFQEMEYKYRTYFARFYAPILFMIGVISVILSDLQVIVSAEQDSDTWQIGVPLWISVGIIVLAYSLLPSLGFIVVYKVAREWKVAIRDHLRLLEEKRAVE